MNQFFCDHGNFQLSSDKKMYPKNLQCIKSNIDGLSRFGSVSDLEYIIKVQQSLEIITIVTPFLSKIN